MLNSNTRLNKYKPTNLSLHTSTLAMSDTEEVSAPDGATAQKLVKEFEAVTNTDEILAQYYLQVRIIIIIIM